MDKKKEINFIKFVFVCAFLVLGYTVFAQNNLQIEFCDKKYEYGKGNDSISLFFRLKGNDEDRSRFLNIDILNKEMTLLEDNIPISANKRNIIISNSEVRIPGDYTFSILVDLNIPESGKRNIFKAIADLVNSAPDSCVYISFLGDSVTYSRLITRQNYLSFQDKILETPEHKYFFSAVYAKISEFISSSSEYDEYIICDENYSKNISIARRAELNRDKNILLIFTEGGISNTTEDLVRTDIDIYNKTNISVIPKIYSFYYTGEGDNENIKNLLSLISAPRNNDGSFIESSRLGKMMPADNFNDIISTFKKVVNDVKYDFIYTYKAQAHKSYKGNTSYTVKWGDNVVGNAIYSIGSAERPWPEVIETTQDSVVKYIVAVLITIITLCVFFIISKIIIPLFKSELFAFRYYKTYIPDINGGKRKCFYCRQEIQAGDKVVTKCRHIMHVHCWKDNGYKCVEYGQNCNDGIQHHVHWKELFSKQSLRDLYQTICGVIAGLISWIIYELSGRSGFVFLAKSVTKIFFEEDNILFNDCVNQISALLMIGFLLGFFLSFIFRYNDEYRNKDWKIYLRIFALSLFNAVIGLVAFIVGSVILCLILSVSNIGNIPWYCALPAYILFSVSVSLGLTVKSSIPVKSALIGGLCASVIGFLVLYFASLTDTKYSWLNLLLDFVIYGGGLGFSLVTVRMLAEKYFLVIQNGVKQGFRIPIHKWMSATGGGNTVTIGMIGSCEIQMNWEKTNKVAKEHVKLYLDKDKKLPVLKPLATKVIYNNRGELPVNKPVILSNGDTFTVGDTIFKYVENLDN